MPKSRTSTVLDVDRAAQQLRDLVVAGELAPGERLVERALAERLGLSRVPVREALRVLVADGLVAERPTGGAMVRVHDPEEVAELLEISHALDAVAVRRMLRAGTDVRALRAVLAEAARALADGRELDATAANARFHDVLVETAPAPMVRETTAPVRGRLRWLLTRHADPTAVHAEHVALVDALEAHDDALVERLLVEHLATSRHALAVVS